MSVGRRMLVGVVTMVSLLGIGGTVQAVTPNNANSTISFPATVWCC